MEFEIAAYYTGGPTKLEKTKLYGLSWQEKYAADKQRKLDALAAGKSMKEANAIAYQYQYAYATTPGGIEKKTQWLKSPAGKQSSRDAAKRYYQKKMAEPSTALAMKEKRRIASKKYRDKVRVALKEKKIREEAMVADLVDDNQ